MDDKELIALATAAGLASDAGGWGVTMMPGETADALPAIRAFAEGLAAVLGMGCFERRSAWVASAERLPIPSEAHDGYFWGWNASRPDEPASLYEAWERDGTPMGFCHEACGTCPWVTHWQPATPPMTPNVELSGLP